MKAAKRILLKAGREKSLQHFHPWVFSGAIERALGAHPGIREVRLVFFSEEDAKTFLGIQD